jgi:hypothetical protein
MKSLFALLFLFLAAFTSSPLVKTKVSDGITVSLPSTLMAMTPEDIALRFPSVRAPLGAYSNQDREIDFSVNISATNWPDGDIVMAQGFFKASLYNLYDRVEMIHEGVQVIRKKNFIYFEFESRMSGDRRKQGYQDPILRYTYIQYLVQPKRTLVFTFSCPRDMREDWEETVKEMMNSIKVK